MADEEHHIDFLETQLDLVAKLGLELYAQHHIGEMGESDDSNRGARPGRLARYRFASDQARPHILRESRALARRYGIAPGRLNVNDFLMAVPAGAFAGSCDAAANLRIGVVKYQG